MAHIGSEGKAYPFHTLTRSLTYYPPKALKG
jgi:hypothetical protein